MTGTAAVIVHTVLAILALRIGVYSFMVWRRLRQKHVVAGSAPAGSERVLMVALPVLAVLCVAVLVNSGVEIVAALGAPAD